MSKEKNSKGITLTALVITIIIMLILVGISVAVALNGGLFRTAKEATVGYKNEQIGERLSIAVQVANAKGKGILTYSNLDEELSKEFGDGNYEIVSVGNNGYIIIVEGVSYKVSLDGKIEEEKVEEVQIEYAGDLSKNGQYDGLTEETALRLSCVEDVLEWSKNYSKYQNSFIKLERTIDFKDPASYYDCLITTTDINGNGENEELIQELSTGTGFNPIASFVGTFDVSCFIFTKSSRQIIVPNFSLNFSESF